MTESNILLKLIYVSYHRQLSFIIVMSTHRYNRAKYCKITINAAFIITFNDRDFQIHWFSKAMSAVLDKTLYTY